MAWWDKLGLGPRLVRPAQVYTAATTPMFAAVGDILLTSIEGEVVGADPIPGGVGNCSLETGGGDIATAVAIAADLVGQRYSVLTSGGALIVAGPPLGNLQEPVMIPDGETIDCTITALTTDPATIEWRMHYLPVSPGAYVALG